MGLHERRQREKEERRKLILDAARGLLFKKGVGGTSINGIAQAAEIGVGTIYSYFRNKEELFAALQEEGLEILNARVRKAARSGKDPRDALRRIAMAYLRFSKEKKDYFDIINYFVSSPEVLFAPDLKTQVDAHGNRVLAHVEAAIREGGRTGIFREVNARQCSILLWGMLHGLIQFKKMRGTILPAGEDPDALFEAGVEHFLESLA